MPAGTNTSWQIAEFGLDGLRLAETPAPEPGPRDLLVRVGAVSLNYKDRLMVDGTLVPNLRLPFVPTSDAAGEVVATGGAVSRFRPGDRVVGQVVSDWIDGEAPRPFHTRTLGMTLPGVLSRYVVLDQDAAVPTPPSLTDEQASTLPIAALTAWFALFETARPLPGSTVLVQGTGGVALFALQFAAAFGLRAIVTSSSDGKLGRAAALGAWRTINYRSRPDWDEAVREITGHGVDHVIETVGGDNVRRSVKALADDGRLSLIGIQAGSELSLPIFPFMRKRLVMQGISIGHRRAFERMNAAIEARGITPVIDAVYPFAEAPRAFEHLARGPFGKVVVSSS